MTVEPQRQGGPMLVPQSEPAIQWGRCPNRTRRIPRLLSLGKALLGPRNSALDLSASLRRVVPRPDTGSRACANVDEPWGGRKA